MRQLWVGTGWKMNHLIGEAEQYSEILSNFCLRENPPINIFICVPFTALHAVSVKLTGSQVLVSAQNVHWLDKGAATGEISPSMVKDAGASMVEIGHSERRAMFNETDFTVNIKVKAALAHNLRPLICIGETAEEKQYGVGFESLIRQLKIALNGLNPQQAKQSLIAYEPVWAIGESGIPATPEYADFIQGKIKQTLNGMFGDEISTSIPVLYGGSVNLENMLSLIHMPNIEGLFIGRAAWKVEGFISIITRVMQFLQPN